MKKIVKNISFCVILLCAVISPIDISKADLIGPFFISKNLADRQINATGSLTFFIAELQSSINQTPNAYDTMTLSSPNFAAQSFEPNGLTNFQLIQTFPTKAALDAAYPFGTYTANALNTVTSATNSDTISYTQDAYPSAQPVVSPATFTGLQGVNPNAPFTISYNGFSPGAGATPGQSSQTVLIQNDSTLAVAFEQILLPNTQTSVTIPADTLMSDVGYTLFVVYDDKILGTSTTETEVDFILQTLVNFTTAPAAVVPEPSSPVLFGSGLGPLGLISAGAFRRRSSG